MIWMIRLSIFISLFVQYVIAWNSLGHEIALAIAERVATRKTFEKASNILKGSKSEHLSTLKSVVVWPDTISGNLSTLWTRTFHFVPIEGKPPYNCKSYDQLRDCPENNCIVNALANYTMRLKDTTLDREERATALKFVIHLAADAHCPPHSTSKDYLGWHSYGAWNNEVIDVHRIWDKQLIEKRVDEMNGQEAYIEYLLKQTFPTEASIAKNYFDFYPTKRKEKQYLENCFSSWISSTNQFLCKSYRYFHVGVEFSGSEYYEKIKTDIDRMMVNAGVRLGKTLDYALSWKKRIC